MNRLLILICLWIMHGGLLGCDKSNEIVQAGMKAGKPFVLTFDTTNTRDLRSEVYVLDSSNRTLTFLIYRGEQWLCSVDQAVIDQVSKMIRESYFFQLPKEVGGRVADAGWLTVSLTCDGATVEKTFYQTKAGDTNFAFESLRSNFASFAKTP